MHVFTEKLRMRDQVLISWSLVLKTLFQYYYLSDQQVELVILELLKGGGQGLIGGDAMKSYQFLKRGEGWWSEMSCDWGVIGISDYYFSQ